MITVKFKAQDAFEIREQAKAVFGLVEPSDRPIYAVENGNISAEETAELEGVASGKIVEVVEAKEEKPKTARRKKAEAAPAEPKQEVIPPNAPDVFSEPGALTDPAAKPDAAEATIEEVRAALSDLIAGKSSQDVFTAVGKYKDVNGEPCKKASQLQPADRAKLIADVRALLAQK